MHYRTLSITVSAIVLFLTGILITQPVTWIAVMCKGLIDVSIIVLTVGILRGKGAGSDPPPRNKWYQY